MARTCKRLASCSWTKCGNCWLHVTPFDRKKAGGLLGTYCKCLGSALAQLPSPLLQSKRAGSHFGEAVDFALATYSLRWALRQNLEGACRKNFVPGACRLLNSRRRHSGHAAMWHNCLAGPTRSRLASLKLRYCIGSPMQYEETSG